MKTLLTILSLILLAGTSRGQTSVPSYGPTESQMACSFPGYPVESAADLDIWGEKGSNHFTEKRCLDLGGKWFSYVAPPPVCHIGPLRVPCDPGLTCNPHADPPCSIAQTKPADPTIVWIIVGAGGAGVTCDASGCDRPDVYWTGTDNSYADYLPKGWSLDWKDAKQYRIEDDPDRAVPNGRHCCYAENVTTINPKTPQTKPETGKAAQPPARNDDHIIVGNIADFGTTAITLQSTAAVATLMHKVENGVYTLTFEDPNNRWRCTRAPTTPFTILCRRSP